MSNIVIINTGNGNFLSVKRAVEKFNKNVKISHDPKEIISASKIILPGVGAFKDSVSFLKKNKIFEIIKEISNQKPILGICLGMQLLFENSNEFGFCDGLNIIQGNIKPLPNQKIDELDYKIPNIGWYNLENNSKNFKYFDEKKDDFYFIHSFYAKDVKDENLLAFYKFGNIKVPAIVKQKKIIGCQFHPEKSRAPGLNIIKYFLES